MILDGAMVDTIALNWAMMVLMLNVSVDLPSKVLGTIVPQLT